LFLDLLIQLQLLLMSGLVLILQLLVGLVLLVQLLLAFLTDLLIVLKLWRGALVNLLDGGGGVMHRTPLGGKSAGFVGGTGFGNFCAFDLPAGATLDFVGGYAVVHDVVVDDRDVGDVGGVVDDGGVVANDALIDTGDADIALMHVDVAFGLGNNDRHHDRKLHRDNRLRAAGVPNRNNHRHRARRPRRGRRWCRAPRSNRSWR